MPDRLWLPMGDWLCATAGDVTHATPLAPVLARRNQTPSRRRRTVDTACGRRAKLTVVPFVNRTTGERNGVSALAWPPPARWDGTDRCRDCWETTGRRRPDPTFRELEATP